MSRAVRQGTAAHNSHTELTPTGRHAC